MLVFLSKLFIFFFLKLKKCSTSAIVECVALQLNLKSLLWKLRCASEIKKIKLRILRRAFTGRKDHCAFGRMLLMATAALYCKPIFFKSSFVCGFLLTETWNCSKNCIK